MVSSMVSSLSVSNLKEQLYKDRLRPRHHFASLVKSYLRPDSWVLDAGCGDGSGLNLRGQCAQVVGYDVDVDVLANPEVDAALVGDLENIDLPSETFDVIVCSWVLEHLSDPVRCFQEFARLLKPGGVVVVMTPNARHYAMVVSRFTPFRFHRWFLNRIGIVPHDHSFPTFYRANTPRQITRTMARAGLQTEEFMMAEGVPKYLSFSLPTFLAGVAYERAVNSWSGLGFMRDSIVASFRKQ